MIFFQIFILCISLGAAEISFDSLCTPSTSIKSIYIDTMSNAFFRGWKIYGIIEKPADIDTIYCLAEKNTPIKKLFDNANENKVSRIDVILEKCPLNFETHNMILKPLLAWAHSAVKSRSFVAYLGEFMETMHSVKTFSERNDLLQANISLCKCLGFVEFSSALNVIKHINEEIEKQIQVSKNYSRDYIIYHMLPKFDHSWKHIAQLDVEFAKRIDPAIFEKMLAQPKYANALTSTKLTDADRNRLVELDLLITAMRTLQEVAELLIL